MFDIEMLSTRTWHSFYSLRGKDGLTVCGSGLMVHRRLASFSPTAGPPRRVAHCSRLNLAFSHSLRHRWPSDAIPSGHLVDRSPSTGTDVVADLSFPATASVS